MTEVKMRSPKVRWEGMPIILTTNALPPVMVEPTRLKNETNQSFKERQILHGAIMSRIRLIEVKVSHGTDEVFPYTTKDLAIYMQHICDNLMKEGQMEIIEESPFIKPEYKPNFDADSH